MEEENSVFDDTEEDEDVIRIRMDITEPLNTIKSILEDQIENIKDYKFTLQGGDELDPNKSLLDLCVYGTGLVQIHLKIGENSNILDIVDVLKPDEEDEDVDVPGEDDNSVQPRDTPASVDPVNKSTARGSKGTQPGSNTEGNSKKPTAKKRKKKSPGQAPAKKPKTKKPTTAQTKPVARSTPNLPPPQPVTVAPTPQVHQISSSNPSSIQLWQFLLELLTSHSKMSVIRWLKEEGEFQLIDPEKVAQLWGVRKNKPNMNYEKLSRALRYYYDGDMIEKVHGKRFVYKFVCDLKFLIGYSASQLNQFVLEPLPWETPSSPSSEPDFPLRLSPPPSPLSEDEVRQGVVVPSEFSIGNAQFV